MTLRAVVRLGDCVEESDATRTLLHEYTILLVCRLTGPPQSFGKANLSTQRFTVLMRKSGYLTPEIERLDTSLREYGELLKPARNKIIAHSDLEVHANATVLGGHEEGQWCNSWKTCKRISTRSATPSASGRRTFGTCLRSETSSTWSGS